MINFITKYITIPNSRAYDKSIQGTIQHVTKLSKCSSYIVQVECEDCKQINKVCYADLRNRDYYVCHKCSMIRKKGISNIKNKGKLPWNKGRKDFLSKESKESMIKKLKGREVWNEGKIGVQIPWNIGKVNIWSKEQLENNRLKNEYHLKDYQEKYELFCQVEELKEEDWVLFGRCKNSECKNSKEKNGWFRLSKGQIHSRLASIFYGDGGAYWYCSEECKEECPIFKKTAVSLIKQDQITAGLIEDPWYTSVEYKIFRDIVLEMDDTLCIWCGKPATIVHHENPQKVSPEQALDPLNGLSSCEECHFKYGHRDRWCTTGYLAKLICQHIIRNPIINDNLI